MDDILYSHGNDSEPPIALIMVIVLVIALIISIGIFLINPDTKSKTENNDCQRRIYQDLKKDYTPE